MGNLFGWFTGNSGVVRTFKSKYTRKIFGVTADDIKNRKTLDEDGNPHDIVFYVRKPRKNGYSKNKSR